MLLQRLLGLAGYGGNGGHNNKQVQPTFGVSFGLPQPSHSYPVNPFGHNPLHNPYGPALNGGGINLGLLSVNPLLAVQVSKNDYGEKIVKPFVNLHVTPNEHVVNKLGDLFHEKKLYLLNKHEHFHHYNNPHYNHNIGPHYPRPPYQFSPHYTPHYSQPPIYSPHYSHYPNHYRQNSYDSLRTPHVNEDYYDDDNVNLDEDDYNQGNYGYERSANVSHNLDTNRYANRYAYSRSLQIPNHSREANRGDQTVRFPESRKRRDVKNENQKPEIIQEVMKPPLFHIYT